MGRPNPGGLRSSRRLSSLWISGHCRRAKGISVHGQWVRRMIWERTPGRYGVLGARLAWSIGWCRGIGTPPGALGIVWVSPPDLSPQNHPLDLYATILYGAAHASHRPISSQPGPTVCAWRGILVDTPGGDTASRGLLPVLPAVRVVSLMGRLLRFPLPYHWCPMCHDRRVGQPVRYCDRCQRNLESFTDRLMQWGRRWSESNQ